MEAGEELAKVLRYYGMIDYISGPSMSIICPFHGDINPSMLVTFDDGRFHCFGCGASGDALAFTQLMEQRYHGFNTLDSIMVHHHIIECDTASDIVVPRSVLSRRRDDSGELYDEAFMYYYGLRQPDWDNLREGEYEALSVRSYMHARGMFSSTLNESGCKATYERAYPMVFPILDGEEFCGWVSRTMDERIAAKRKYLYNKGFHRSNVLDGRYTGMGNTVMAVEGHMDMLRCRQNGVENVVALLGWALGEGQLQKLREAGVRHVLCATDNDEGGRRGYRRLRDAFGSDNVARFVFGSFKDPGEMDYTAFNRCMETTVREYGAMGLRYNFERGIVSWGF